MGIPNLGTSELSTDRFGGRSLFAKNKFDPYNMNALDADNVLLNSATPGIVAGVGGSASKETDANYGPERFYYDKRSWTGASGAKANRS